MTKNINIIPTEGAEETLEIMASAITTLSEGMTRIMASPLKQYTLVLLLQKETGLAQRDIKLILDTLPRLKEIYLKPAKTK